MSPELILPKPSRYNKLKGWLHFQGLTFEGVAKAAGLHPETCRQSLRRERIRQERLDQFLALGIPKSLLPKPWRKKKH